MNVKISWKKIPGNERERMIVQWVEKRHRGNSWSEIAREFGVDRRTVRDNVEEYEKRQSGTDTIRPNILTDIFQQHREEMHKAAEILLFIIYKSSPMYSLSFTGIDNIEQELIKRMIEHISPYRLMPPGEPEPGEEEFEQHLKEVRANKAINGLKQHIPSIQAKINRWQQLSQEYQNIWNKLKAAMKEEKIQVPDDWLSDSVREALELLPSWDDNKQYGHFPKKATSPEHYSPTLLNRSKTRLCLQNLRKLLQDMDKLYRELESQLTFPQLDTSLALGHCDYCSI